MCSDCDPNACDNGTCDCPDNDATARPLGAQVANAARRRLADVKQDRDPYELLMPPPADWRTPPDHYAGEGNMSPWDIWEAFNLDPWSANVIKYVLRAGKKDGASRLDDFTKARNYLEFLIDREG